MIEIQHLTKEFNTSAGAHKALCDINLTINDRDIFGVIGGSGAGKSTLVRCINMLERPSSGHVIVDGVDVTTLKGKQLDSFRRTIGMIFQNFSLFSQRTVLENIMFPLQIRGDSREHCLTRAHELLDLVGLANKADSYPSQLSGGQQQRVSIARSLANHPNVILCDEATSALDPLTTNSILKLLRSINRDLGVTIVVITHEMSVVEKICNKVAVLDDSRIVEQGDVSTVFANPQAEVTKSLLGQVSWDA